MSTKRTALRRPLTAAATCVATACLNPPTALKSEKANFTNASLAISSLNNDNNNSSVGSDTLALGDSMVAELRPSLVSAGLTDDQISTVQAGAKSSVAAGVVAIQEASLALAVLGQPVQFAAPAVISGAVKALGEIGVEKDEFKAGAVQAIVGSAFKSLNGRTGSLASGDLSSLAKQMTTKAVSNLTAAGFASSSIGLGTRSITTGSISNLQAAGISSDAMSSIANAVVTGAVSQLATINLPTADIASAVSGAAAGAVASISSTGLSSADTVALAGTLTASSVQSLTSFTGASQATLVSAMQGISSGAVGALKAANINASSLGSAVQAIATAGVAALSSVGQSSGLGTNLVTAGAAAVCSGAITGLATAAPSESAAATASATASIITGTMNSLASSASGLSASDKSTAVAAVVGSSVQALSSIGSESTKTAVMSAVISTSVGSLQTLGLDTNATSAASTLQAMTSSATQALSTAGFSSATLATASQAIVTTTVSSASSLSTTSASTLGNLVSGIVNGVSAGMTALANSGQASATVAAAAINSSVQTAVTAVSSSAAGNNLSASALSAITQQVTAAAPPSVAFGTPLLNLTVGMPVPPMPPSSSQGTFSSCSVKPTLPAGLTLASNCAISGTPTVASALQTYTITPNGGAGVPLQISVALSLPPPLPQIAYAQSTYQYYAAGTPASPTSIAPATSGAPLTGCSVNQPLPPGLTLTPECVVTGSIDYAVLNNGNSYNPQGVVATNAQGMVVAQGGGDGGVAVAGLGGTAANTSPPYNTDGNAGITYTVPFIITPSSAAGNGPSVLLYLELVAAPAVYPYQAYTFTVQQQVPFMSAILPATQPSAIQSCAISPMGAGGTSFSSTGLQFSTTTCAIWGYPAVARPQDTYTVTATLASGATVSQQVQIGVAPQRLSGNYSVSSPWLGYLGQGMSASASFFSGASPTSCTISPSLPAGLQFDTVTCNISGTPTASIATTNFTITPYNSAGQGNTIPLTIKIMGTFSLNSVNTSADRAIKLNWSPVANAAGYLVVAQNNGSGSANANPVSWSGQPLDGQSYSPQPLSPAQMGTTVIYSATNTTAIHENLSPNFSYSYAVYAYDNNLNYISVAQVTGVYPSQVYTGLDDAFVLAPPRTTSGTATAYYGFAFGFDSGSGYGPNTYDQDLFTAATIGTLNYGEIWQSGLNNTTFFSASTTPSSFAAFDMTSYNSSPLSSPNSRPNPIVVNAGTGYQHKIYGRNRFNNTLPTQAALIGPGATIADQYGNVLFSTANGNINVICQENNNASYCTNRIPGQMFTIAGSDAVGNTGGPVAPTLPLGSIQALAVDNFDNIYMYDSTNNLLRVQCNRTSQSTGFCSGMNRAEIYTLAGTGSPGTLGAGTSNSVSISGQIALAVNAFGNVFMAQGSKNEIFVLCNLSQGPFCTNNSVAEVYPVAGDGSASPGDSASVGSANALAVDPWNNLYIADSVNNRVLVLCLNNATTSSNNINNPMPSTDACASATVTPPSLTLFAGIVGNSSDGATGGSATSTAIGSPQALASDAFGNIYLTDSTNYRIRVVCQNSNTNVGWCEGSGNQILNVGFGGSGNNLTYGGVYFDSGLIGNPSGLAVDSSGNMFIADTTNNHIVASCENGESRLCLDLSDDAVVVAGIVPNGFYNPYLPALAADAPLLSKNFSSVVDPNGNLYVSDPGQHRIFNVGMGPGGWSPGMTYAFAGSGSPGTTGASNGATLATAVMNNANGMASDPSGNIVVAGGTDGYVYLLCNNGSGACSGKAATHFYNLAGNGNASGSASGNSPSTSVGTPTSVASDSYGNIFIADGANNLIYLVCVASSGSCSGKTAGDLYTIAGNGGTATCNTDTSATAATNQKLNLVTAMAVDSANNLVFTEAGCSFVRTVCFSSGGGLCTSGATGNIYRYAGSGTNNADSSDGTALTAVNLPFPTGLAIDANNNVMVSTGTSSGVGFPRIWMLCDSTSAGFCSQNSRAVNKAYQLTGDGSTTASLPSNSPFNASTPIPAPVGYASDYNRLSFDGHNLYLNDGAGGNIRVFIGAD